MVKRHVWRPLWVVLGLAALILLARAIYVPADFGIGVRGYMYGYHRQANEQDWRNFPLKYQTTGYCRDCHAERVAQLMASFHGIIPCEDCHGAAFDHPQDPAKLVINRSRGLCLRCHAQLVTPTSGRSAIPGIDPERHNPEYACSDCHNPHDPNLEEM